MLKRILCIAVALATAWAAHAGPRTILVWGDSLSAAYGITKDQGWVSLLDARLSGRGMRIVNHSVSGETTAGGLARLPRALAEAAPELVVLELGANDGLRGLNVRIMKRNLKRMIELSRAAGARVLLLGMKLPPNYGRAYGERFHRVYLDLAAEHDVELVPFLLEPIALDYGAFQSDGLHPTAAAQPAILDHVWPALSRLLGE